MTFAIITPALVIGAYVERMKFAAVLIFDPVAALRLRAGDPLVWGGGIMAGWGVMDFAGGIVVHATAGTAALVCAVMVGRRRSFPAERQPTTQPGPDDDRRRDAVGRLVDSTAVPRSAPMAAPAWRCWSPIRRRDDLACLDGR